MRVIGRYFAMGATLGSVSGLVALVLIWTWMTIHLGVFGFLVGWIPAGLAAAALWLVMVLFWGPILIVGAMISLTLLLFRGHPGRDWSPREPPAASEPDEVPAPPETDAPRDAAAPAAPAPADEAPPMTPAPAPPPAMSPPPASPPPLSAPSPGPTPPPPAPRARAPESLDADADAAGDTSRKPPR
jgi:hypothetical protein